MSAAHELRSGDGPVRIRDDPARSAGTGLCGVWDCGLLVDLGCKGR
jgi:hypothetical protein